MSVMAFLNSGTVLPLNDLPVSKEWRRKPNPTNPWVVLLIRYNWHAAYKRIENIRHEGKVFSQGLHRLYRDESSWF